MAQGDILFYNSFLEDVFDDVQTLSTDTVKAALVVSHTFDATDTQWSDASGDETSGTGYTAGGDTVTVSTSTAAQVFTFDISDPAWTGLDAGTPSHVIVYNDTHASDKLLFAIESGKASNGGDYTVEINASGVFTIDFS